MRLFVHHAGNARFRPVVWVLLLGTGSLLLAALTGREADRASRTAQVLMGDYASFVAEKFLRESEDRYASLVGMRGFGEAPGQSSPFGLLRQHGAEAAAGKRAELPLPNRPWVLYLFAYDAHTSSLVTSGTAPDEGERADLRELLQRIDPQCGANQSFPLGRLGVLSRPARHGAVEWSGLVQTGGRSEVRAVQGLRVDEGELARSLLVPMIDPDSECQCLRELLPAGLMALATAGQAVRFVLRDGGGRVFFASRPEPFHDEAPRVTKGLSSGLPLVGWTLEVAISAEAVRPLLPHGGRGTHWVLLAALAALTVGSAALALQSFQRNAELMRLRQDFVSNVSHELKTPLTRIRLFNELLMRGGQTDETRRSRYRQVIDRECRRLTFLVDNVLDFSRFERGARRGEMAPVDLRGVVESALESFRAASDEGRFSLQAELEDVPLVVGNGPALSQVVINLLDNAVKYSPEGGPIEVRLVSADGTVRLSVRDRGRGIPMAEQDRVFEEFYRVETGDAQCVAGSGLGLALVRQTVGAHHGRVTVESEVGAGSTFEVRLPAQVTVAGAEPPAGRDDA